MSDSPVRAFTPAALGRIAGLLAGCWTAGPHVWAASAAARPADAAAPRTVEDYAHAIAGIVAAGGTKAEVAAFLRAEEDALLGGPRTAPRDLAAIGRGAWLAARGRSEEDEAGDDADGTQMSTPSTEAE